MIEDRFGWIINYLFISLDDLACILQIINALTREKSSLMIFVFFTS